MKTLQNILDNRFSCRKFQNKKIPRKSLEKIFMMAQRTPSWCNSQAWQVELLSGDALEDFKHGIYDLARKNIKQTPDFIFPERYDGVYKHRRKVCGVQLYESLGIGKHEPEAARKQLLENFKCFDAPHLAMITSTKLLGVYGAVDCGLYINTLMLAAADLGINSIAQAALASYPAYVREYLHLSDDRMVVCGISLGYEEKDSPINHYRTDRADISDVVNWVG